MRRGNLSGKKVLALLAAFFGVIIAVNTLFIVEAIDTFRGEDEQNPYLQGIEYNRTLKQRSEQAILGWNAILSARRDVTGHVQVTIGMHDRTGKPVDHLMLVTRLRHPADSAKDRTIALTAIGNGTYVGSVAGVAPGRWDLVIHLAAPTNAAFESDSRLWLR